MKKISLRGYSILAVAFLLGLGCAFGTSCVLGEEVKAGDNSNVVVQKTTVVRSVAPIRRAFVPAWRPYPIPYAIPTVKSNITFESRPAPAYTVVESPRAPFVVRGIWRDRIVQPRRSNLSIEIQ